MLGVARLQGCWGFKNASVLGLQDCKYIKVIGNFRVESLQDWLCKIAGVLGLQGCKCASVAGLEICNRSRIAILLGLQDCKFGMLATL